MRLPQEISEQDSSLESTPDQQQSSNLSRVSLAGIAATSSALITGTVKFAHDQLVSDHDSTRRSSPQSETDKLIFLFPGGLVFLTLLVTISKCYGDRKQKLAFQEIFHGLEDVKLCADKNGEFDQYTKIEDIAKKIAKSPHFQKKFHRELVSALKYCATHHSELNEDYFKSILNQAYGNTSSSLPPASTIENEESIRKELVLAIRNDEFQLDSSLYKGKRDNPLFQLALSIKNPELTIEEKENIYKVPSPQSSDLESANINISTKDLFLIYSLSKINKAHIPDKIFKLVVNQPDIIDGLSSLVKEGYDRPREALAMSVRVLNTIQGIENLDNSSVGLSSSLGFSSALHRSLPSNSASVSTIASTIQTPVASATKQ
jgi:hypothetical protein